jgi:hypothetical protein
MIMTRCAWPLRTGAEFIDWKGVALDGSHNTHASIVGERLWVNPVGPGWANPKSGTWDDPRVRGRDGRPYGPLPRDWTHYQGLYFDGNRVIIAYTVGDTEVRESPGLLERDGTQVFTRAFNLGPTSLPLTLRLAPDDPALGVFLRGPHSLQLRRENGLVTLQIPESASPLAFRVYLARVRGRDAEVLSDDDSSLLELGGALYDRPARWATTITTPIVRSGETGPFAVDTLTLPPADNPWGSWMRCGGFDFFTDPNRAAVCTWNGDVWTVEGIAQPQGELRWRRIVAGLFQPLGLKIINDAIYVSCCDQIALLRDLNGDGEIDLVASFNNDHQVTEHFHEFATGLQTDNEGNFYYAKGGRHRLPALVPQHGTLMRVSSDGRRTEIVANGFRAPNGVCVNSDGTFFLTDEEGHWTPKNRINLVKPGRFYGYMLGYTDPEGTSDSAMEQPLVWITNSMDRSPAEPLWVPAGAWGPLGDSLLNLS